VLVNRGSCYSPLGLVKSTREKEHVSLPLTWPLTMQTSALHAAMEPTRRLHLVGHSFGGATLVEYLSSTPTRREFAIHRVRSISEVGLFWTNLKSDVLQRNGLAPHSPRVEGRGFALSPYHVDGSLKGEYLNRLILGARPIDLRS
jgi:pimeloyl-ACP methyl ester carboxylesterase